MDLISRTFSATTYSDNQEIERRIFHLAKEFNVSLFERDAAVDSSIQSLYRVGTLILYRTICILLANISELQALPEIKNRIRQGEINSDPH